MSKQVQKSWETCPRSWHLALARESPCRVLFLALSPVPGGNVSEAEQDSLLSVAAADGTFLWVIASPLLCPHVQILLYFSGLRFDALSHTTGATCCMKLFKCKLVKIKYNEKFSFLVTLATFPVLIASRCRWYHIGQCRPFPCVDWHWIRVIRWRK